MDDGMHLDAAFLLPRLRIAPNTLENEVREQADGGGVDDLQPLHPFWHLVGGAVRQKSVLVGQVQVHVDFPKIPSFLREFASERVERRGRSMMPRC